MLSDDVIYELDDGTLVDLSSVYYITPVKFYKARTAIAYIFSEDEGIDCSRDVYNFEIHSNNDVVMFVNHYSKKAADNSRDKLRKAWKKMKCPHCGKYVELICARCHCEDALAQHICVICQEPVCDNCVDWDCMKKTGTDNIICEECSQLFTNCRKEGKNDGRTNT